MKTMNRVKFDYDKVMEAVLKHGDRQSLSVAIGREASFISKIVNMKSKNPEYTMSYQDWYMIKSVTGVDVQYVEPEPEVNEIDENITKTKSYQIIYSAVYNAVRHAIRDSKEA